MSFRRALHRANNRNAYLDNRLTTFTNLHVYYGNLHVENDETIDGNLIIGKDLRANNYYATGNYYLDTFILIPAGTIIMSACVSEPGGWLDCNGRLLTVSTYQDLFTAIGYSFGGSDSSFNIPDMRGRAGIGLGQGTSLTNRTLAATGGSETHTLSTTEMPSHSHNITDPGHTHTQTTVNDDFNSTGSYPNYNTPSFAQYDSAGSKTWSNINSANTGISINSTGGGGAHNNMQPFVVLRYLIKY